eukprot:6197588-Lingulodinium_polyedra.AAC.1
MVPTVPNSQVPGLLGLRSMMARHLVINTVNRGLHLCGPGDLELTLPPRAQTFELDQSPSGHLLLP